MNSSPAAQIPEYEARRFTEFLHARVTHVIPRGVVMGKIARKEIVATFGVRVPVTYEVFPDLDSVTFSRLPSRFVLKPIHLWSSHGVYLLVRQEGKFYDLISKQSYSEEQILAALKSLFERLGKTSAPILAEELVVGENGENQIPFDYKFWMFGETIGIIMQCNRNTNPVQLTCFGDGFLPLPEGASTVGGSRAQGSPVIPANADAMLETAKNISLSLDTPFCGIDLYTTGNEVYFGELSPTPGAAYYGRMLRLSPEFDSQLGAYWRQGCLVRGQPIPKLSSPTPVMIVEQSEKLIPST